MSASWMGSHFTNDDLVKQSRFADDYTFEAAPTGHFIADERPDLVRAKLIALAEETAAAAR